MTNEQALIGHVAIHNGVLDTPNLAITSACPSLKAGQTVAQAVALLKACGYLFLQTDTAFWLWPQPISEALKQSQEQFVNVVSHEFRTPLTSIKGFADTLLSHGHQLDDTQKRRFVGIIKDQADRLTRMVENLLTSAKSDAGQQSLHWAPVDLSAALDKALKTLQGKGVSTERFEVSMPASLPHAWADADQVEQVFLNLCDNAHKYSPGGAPIVIQASIETASTQSEEMLQVTITDSGIGIPPEYLPHVFSRFSRIDNPLTRQVEGTGLGLYITKALMVAMGGSISVTSPPMLHAMQETGTQFILQFAVATPEKQAAFHQQRVGQALVL